MFTYKDGARIAQKTLSEIKGTRKMNSICSLVEKSFSKKEVKSLKEKGYFIGKSILSGNRIEYMMYSLTGGLNAHVIPYRGIIR